MSIANKEQYVRGKVLLDLQWSIKTLLDQNLAMASQYKLLIFARETCLDTSNPNPRKFVTTPKESTIVLLNLFNATASFISRQNIRKYLLFWCF